MRRFSNEFRHQYGTYSFGYTNWAVREKLEKVSPIYDGGFLPYSGNLSVRDTFYMARSARVVLEKFVPTSENRRIAKRHDEIFTRTIIPLTEFTVNETFLTFCLEYFAKRHGPDVMPRERLEFMLSLSLITHIAEYTKDEKPVAYVFEVSDSDITHFWSSFYDLSYLNQSLGLWLMLDSIRHAKESGKKYFYLGTAYGEKGLYKTNFEPLEFWNGETWVRDSRLLKELCRSDKTREV